MEQERHGFYEHEHPHQVVRLEHKFAFPANHKNVTQVTHQVAKRHEEARKGTKRREKARRWKEAENQSNHPTQCHVGQLDGRRAGENPGADWSGGLPPGSSQTHQLSCCKVGWKLHFQVLEAGRVSGETPGPVPECLLPARVTTVTPAQRGRIARFLCVVPA